MQNHVPIGRKILLKGYFFREGRTCLEKQNHKIWWEAGAQKASPMKEGVAHWLREGRLRCWGSVGIVQTGDIKSKRKLQKPLKIPALKRCRLWRRSLGWSTKTSTGNFKGGRLTIEKEDRNEGFTLSFFFSLYVSFPLFLAGLFIGCEKHTL